MIKKCIICDTEFETIKYGKHRKYCYDCIPTTGNRAKQISEMRIAIKNKLVSIHSGKCNICGYNKCIGALEFHHLDPTEKDFSISTNKKSNYYELLVESEKCILVCANCHREIHSDVHNDFLSRYTHSIDFEKHKEVYNNNY